MKKAFKAFTLVELLIVMGILAILMTIGISVGRFAIQRANNIQHQAAVDQFGQAIQSYYTDNRRYPADLNSGGTTDPAAGALDEYIDSSFDGGSPATFLYATSTSKQSYLMCVSYGDIADEMEFGFYCTGDGFEEDSIYGGAVSEKEVEFSTVAPYITLETASEGADGMDWNGTDWE